MHTVVTVPGIYVISIIIILSFIRLIIVVVYIIMSAFVDDNSNDTSVIKVTIH